MYELASERAANKGERGAGASPACERTALCALVQPSDCAPPLTRNPACERIAKLVRRLPHCSIQRSALKSAQNLVRCGPRGGSSALAWGRVRGLAALLHLTQATKPAVWTRSRGGRRVEARQAANTNTQSSNYLANNNL